MRIFLLPLLAAMLWCSGCANPKILGKVYQGDFSEITPERTNREALYTCRDNRVYKGEQIGETQFVYKDNRVYKGDFVGYDPLFTCRDDRIFAGCGKEGEAPILYFDSGTGYIFGGNDRKLPLYTRKGNRIFGGTDLSREPLLTFTGNMPDELILFFTLFAIQP